ncbi:MAG: hypothetical protein R3B54_07165 [Bdellovibrionota bacterium]
MSRLGAFLFLIIFLTNTARVVADDGGHGAHGPRDGRYFGYAKMTTSPLKIPAILDLVVVQSTSEYMHMRATLRLLLGGFGSPEYITQYYEMVSYSMESGLLVLEGNAEEVTLLDVMAHEMDGKFMVMGKIRSANGNAEGQVLFYLDEGKETPEELTKSLFQNADPVPALTGNYLGECDGVAQNLQLEAIKMTANEMASLNPLLGYHIQGRLGAKNGNCSADSYCATSHYHSGSYNFYRNQLVLGGRPKPLVCNINKNSLVCDSCTYSKEANSLDGDLSSRSYTRDFHIDRDEGEPLPLTPTPRDISGTFEGYLHHEFTNRYQYMKLSVKGFMKLVAPHTEYLHASATAWLNFGEPESSEFISYKFDQREFRSTFPHFVFEGHGEVQDGILQITDWRSDRILGVWYSKTFGRVGTVELLKGSLPALDPNAQKVPSLGGAYEGPFWNFDLIVMPGTVASQTLSFYPLQLAGTARIKKISALENIIGGSYDFYTDRFSFALNDRIIVGKPRGSNGMSLFWPGKPIWGVNMSTPQLAEYVTKDGESIDAVEERKR